MYRAAVLASLGVALAHGGAGDVDPSEPWQVRHMKIEHGYDDFDPKAFFLEHDVDNSRYWTKEDIIRLYGLQKDTIVGDGTGMGTDEETVAITDDDRERVYQGVLALLDTNEDGKVSMDEWRKFCEDQKTLPDFGYGTGHHGDYEYEYEVHHWRQYHMENDPDVKIQHPEDEEHERLYHQYEHHDDSWADHDPSWVRKEQIPNKFLKKTERDL